jgi:AcrR family transcriptional regulator
VEESGYVANASRSENGSKEPQGRRAQNRIERTRAFLSSALTIVTTEGFDALTMSRLAEESDSAIGAVYRYFPSKGAIIAEVQREAIERLHASYTLIRERGDRWFADKEIAGADLALSRLLLIGRWFCATTETHPLELRLLQMLMSDWPSNVPMEEGLRVLPSAMRLLDRARACIEDAQTVGVLTDAPEMERVIVWAASLGGVLQVSRLDVFDAALFDGARLAREFNRVLIVGWGASGDAVSRCDALIDELGERGPLAPVVGSTGSGGGT